MQSAAARKAARALVALALPIMAFAEEAPKPLAVPARKVPVPDAVSAELRKVIGSPLPPKAKMPTTAQGWKKLQRERDAEGEQTARAAAKRLGVKVEPKKVAGVPCYLLTPKAVAPAKAKHLIVHVHGGAFVFYGGLAATWEAAVLADACKARVLSIDYRMPPDHPFPAAPDDVLAVWKAVLKEHDRRDVVMGGTSAGGALVLTTMLRCKADKVAMPAALFLGTPWADLTKSGDSVYLNAEVDNVLGRYEGRLEACAKLYAKDRDLKDPLLSPARGDLSGLPPAILLSGTRDLLLSPTVRTHRKLRAAGVPAELHVYEGMSHADYLVGFPAPEARDAWAEVASFFDRHLNR